MFKLNKHLSPRPIEKAGNKKYEQWQYSTNELKIKISFLTKYEWTWIAAVAIEL